MIFIQMTGLSGVGKSTIAYGAQSQLSALGISCTVIDGDKYRLTLSKDLGYSYADRIENIRRLSELCEREASAGKVAILAAIKPYEIARERNKALGGLVKTVWIHCDINILIKRDTKGLYRRALLPDDHAEKLNGLTGVDDPFETPLNSDLFIDTANEPMENSVKRLVDFILKIVKTS